MFSYIMQWFGFGPTKAQVQKTLVEQAVQRRKEACHGLHQAMSEMTRRNGK